MWPFQRSDERVAQKQEEQRRLDIEGYHTHHGRNPFLRSLELAFRQLVETLKSASNFKGGRDHVTGKLIKKYGLLVATVVAFLFVVGVRKPTKPFEITTHPGHFGVEGGRKHHWPGWAGIRRIYAFGDSHTDTGFYLDGSQPDQVNPLGNPKFPGSTRSHGPNYLSHLIGTFNESFIKTYNLATSGSIVVDRTIFTNLRGEAFPRLNHWTLSNQVDYAFLSRYGVTTKHLTDGQGNKWHSDESLFVLYPGNNEILEEYLKRHGRRNMTETELYMHEIEKNLNSLYKYGARNFLILNNPCLEEAPAIHVSGIIDGEGRLGAEIVDLNGRLAATTQHFAEAHSDATVFLFDNYNLTMRVRGHPSDFEETANVERLEGFCFPYAEMKDELNTDDPLCGVPLNHWFWRDDEHITEPYQRLMARMIVQHVGNIDNALPYEFY